jgi:hypothetical protein
MGLFADERSNGTRGGQNIARGMSQRWPRVRPDALARRPVAVIDSQVRGNLPGHYPGLYEKW